MKWLERQEFRFLVAGVINNVISYALYLALLLVSDYRVAYSVSYLAGFLVSFVLNSVYVFRQPLRWRQLFAYPLVYIMQFVVGLLCTWAFVELLGWPEAYAPIAVILVCLPLTYLGTRFVLVARKHDPAPHQ